MKVNYLNKKDLLIEIHKSKLTYCSLINSNYQDNIYKFYDIIVSSLDDIDKELIDYTKKFKAERVYKQKRDELLKLGFKPHEIKLSSSPDDIKDEDVVFRIITYDHIPPNKKPKKTKVISEKDKHEKTNFTPFKHYIFVDNTPVEVLRSHWIGSTDNGYFSTNHGHMTNNLAKMFMEIVEKFSKKGNWRGYCVDESTEALTQRGWLGINQINENDKILSYSDGDMKWSKIKSIYRGDFDGNMHNLTMRGLDMLITPNHKLVTQRGLIPVEFLKETDHLILMGNISNECMNLCADKTLFVDITNLYSNNKTILVECIDFHGGKKSNENIPTTYYKGKVWCPETEYGCFVARRNNTIYLTGNTYIDEMRSQALLQLSQIGLQFDEDRSNIPNPFAYYTAAINNSFTRILNIEKKNQCIRDDILESYGATPSYTRQNEWNDGKFDDAATTDNNDKPVTKK